MFRIQMLNVEQMRETIYSACVVTLSKEEERRPLKMRTIQTREDGLCLCIALMLSHFKAMSKCGRMKKISSHKLLFKWMMESDHQHGG